MSAEDLEKYETEMELQLYREYRDVVRPVHLRRRDRAALLPDQRRRPARAHADGGEVYFEVTMHDAWVWDMYRPARFVKNVRVLDVQGRQRRGAREEPISSCPSDKPGFKWLVRTPIRGTYDQT